MNIKQLAIQFRSAIEDAMNDGQFDDDFSFYKFPKGCCGDTCELLAQYLLDHHIKTDYVCGHYGSSFETMGTHAWLQTDNNIIIDITGDQFRSIPELMNNNIPVYVDYKSKFYNLFDVEKRDIHPTNGIDSLGPFCQPRLKKLYSTILMYI